MYERGDVCVVGEFVLAYLYNYTLTIRFSQEVRRLFPYLSTVICCFSTDPPLLDFICGKTHPCRLLGFLYVVHGCGKLKTSLQYSYTLVTVGELYSTWIEVSGKVC